MWKELDVKFEDRKWGNKSYFFPIFRDELNKNNLLVQNPGY
ncbi:RagB/SusD family nutrient uptake outer membrane protein [Olivibacter sp. CPCC 100613]